jgi:hypothetical protein
MGRGKSATPRPISPILFAFTSPENPARTVLAADVFPTCGVDAVFSNAINHSIVVGEPRWLTSATPQDSRRAPRDSLQLSI